MTTYTFRRIAGHCAAVLVGATLIAQALSAQAGPPVAKAPRDTQPTLQRPKSPSAPPSSVAPRTRVSAPQQAAIDSSVRPAGRAALPPDSVRPAPSATVAPDPRRAPAQRVAPPPPAARASQGVQQVTQRAALTSDAPPAGATARCKDGTFVSTTVDANTCSGNGGLAVRIPAPPTAPKRPNP